MSDPGFSTRDVIGVRDRRITVLRIIDRLNVGGPAIHAVLATRGLDPERFRTVLVIGSIEPGEGDMGYLLEEYGIKEVVSIPSLGRELRPIRDLWTAWQLLQVMRRERPDIVHTHKAKAGAIGRLVALIYGAPVRIHTFHGHVLSSYFGPVKSAMFAAIERKLAKVTSRLITPSERLADELSTVFRVHKRDRFQVIPLGFDLSRFANCEELHGRLRAELGLGPEARLIGIVGRMVPVKAHATFVAAADLLAKRRDDVHFVFVGGGALEPEIRAEVAARGIGARCHFLGWRRDLPTIYADLDVATLSSLNEGTPVSLIEAMASGVPVVSTNVGGVSDVLRDGARGYLVPPLDPPALADALERALAPEARARAKTIRGRMSEEYGAARLCQDLCRLYLELVGWDPTPVPVATSGLAVVPK
jgi:glycosyltransferase involved in cell wall biosynthesis